MSARTRRVSSPARQEPHPTAYVDIFRATPADRIRMIKDGVAATQAKLMFAALGMNQGDALAALNLSAATVNRKAARNEALSSSESERVIGVAKLIGQLQAMIDESGDPEGFDAAAWMSRWLKEPLPAIGGQCPIDLLDTMEGQALVGTMLARMQSGAYS